MSERSNGSHPESSEDDFMAPVYGRTSRFWIRMLLLALFVCIAVIIGGMLFGDPGLPDNRP